MTDVLEMLANDIVQIVYRYAFEWNYRILRNQYRKVWLGKRKIYWNDARCGFFKYTGGYIANYRPFWNRRTIKRFKDGTRGPKLPKNYY